MSLSRRLGCSAAIFFGLLVGLEIAGRLLPVPSPPSELPDHPQRGWSLPVAQSFSFDGVPAVTNSLGLRSPEPTQQPHLRILTLGDSSVFGHGVADDETFAAVLAARTGADVQNGGVPGYTCAQSALRYSEVVEDLQPDIVLVYSALNDARIIRSDEAWMGAVPHPVGIFRLAAAGATWLRIQRGVPRLTVGEYRRCLTGLIAAQAARGGQTMLITPVSEVDFSIGGDVSQRPLIGPYYVAMSEVAAQTETRLLDLLDQRWTQGRDARVLMRDPVHPSAMGHALIARWIHAGLLAAEMMEGPVPEDLPRPGTRNAPFSERAATAPAGGAPR